jgi:hypothetical protein
MVGHSAALIRVRARMPLYYILDSIARTTPKLESRSNLWYRRRVLL